MEYYQSYLKLTIKVIKSSEFCEYKIISAGHFMLGYLFSEYCAHGRCWALCVQRVHSVLGC